MKEVIVDSALGRGLLEISRWRALHTLSLRNPESAAVVANAILADRLIQRLCPRGGTFFDIGAHIGSVLSSVHHFDNTINIYAFEADPEKARRLKQKYGYCKIFSVAVGDSSSEMNFYINLKSTGYNSLVEGKTKDASVIKVQVARIDDLLPQESADLIKIDIEGAELGALKGAESLIRRSAPTIMFESVGVRENSLGYSAEQLWEWFTKMGYGIFTPDRLAHTAAPFTKEVFLDSNQYPFRSHNYFGVSMDRRIEVRDKAREILGI